jgi:hypothetical protein
VSDVANPLRNSCVIAVLRELADHGITRPQIEIEQTQRGIKIFWMQGAKKRMVTCGLTPSDHRAALNVRSMTRRLLRETA